MTRSKLSDSDRQSILALYQEPLETTSTLAERYGVSSTTIRRILKSSLSQQEYEALTNLKQAGRFHSPSPEENTILLPPEVVNNDQITALKEDSDQPSFPKLRKVETAPAAATQDKLEEHPVVHSRRRLRKRSSAASTSTVSQTEPSSTVTLVDTVVKLEETQELAELVSAVSQTEPSSTVTVDTVVKLEEAQEPAELVSKDYDSLSLYDSDDQAEDFSELEEELDNGIEDLEDSSLEDSLEAEVQDSFDERASYLDNPVKADSLVRVLPLSEAAFPGTYYLVIDRFADLITRPLKDFGDLGRFPSEEIQEKTLPVFDNHRVARRFSNRTQRVIKVPNGSMLQKVCSHLYSKGITRLLLNGQVYSLSGPLLH